MEEGGRARLISKRGRAAAWKINSESALESGARTSTLFCSGNSNSKLTSESELR